MITLLGMKKMDYVFDLVRCSRCLRIVPDNRPLPCEVDLSANKSRGEGYNYPWNGIVLKSPKIHY